MVKKLRFVTTLVLMLLSVLFSTIICYAAEENNDTMNPPAVAISAGPQYLLILFKDGTVKSCGKNDIGQLGDGTTTSRFYPTKVKNLENIIAISAGTNFNLALDKDGYVWGWGDNTYGQLGSTNEKNIFTPIKIPGLTEISKISAGFIHAMAIQKGKVLTWGSNSSAELGVGDDNVHSTIQTVAGISDIVDISAGDAFSFAKTVNNELYGWGCNQCARLGTSKIATEIFTPLLLSTKVYAIETGVINSFINHFGNNSIEGTGDNRYGQVGYGTTAYIALSEFAPVYLFPDVNAKISNYWYHTLIADHGMVYSSGFNGFGQLGLHNGVPRLRNEQCYFDKVDSLDNIIDVAAGEEFSAALRSDGTVWTWGLGDDGQLGWPVRSPYTSIPQKVVLYDDIPLICDTTDNDLDHDIEIQFQPNTLFEKSITNVSYAFHPLRQGTYSISSGKITLYKHGFEENNISIDLGIDVPILVNSSLFNVSIARQHINNGKARTIQLTQQPVLNAQGGFSKQPVIVLKDQYGNVCTDGISSGAAVTVSVVNGTGTCNLEGETTIQAKAGSAQFDLKCNLGAPGTVQLKFESEGYSVISDYLTVPEYTIDTSGIITSYIGSGGDITIPTVIGTIPVTGIGGSVFKKTTINKLTNIIIPYGVTSIGKDAFLGCIGLTSVTIPSSVKSIGSQAFSGCSSLSSVTFYGSLPRMGQNVFASTSADFEIYFCNSDLEVTIPDWNKLGFSINRLGIITSYSGLERDVKIPLVLDGIIVTGIGQYAFYSCEGLNSITIPSSVTNIDENAFASCHNLSSATFDGLPPVMGLGVFDGASSNFKIYYNADIKGYSNPTWCGYKTAAMGRITYIGNENTTGTVPVDNNIYIQHLTITLMGNTNGLVKTDYTFAGWNTAADGSGISYSEGETLTMGSTNITLYAKWSIITGLNVTVTTNNGSFTGSTLNYSYGDTVKLTTVPTEGYKFVNWTDKTGTILSTNEIYSFIITDNIELIANFTDKYDANNDGKVDIADLQLVSQNYNTNNLSLDFNKDGVVDIFDLAICSRRIQK